MASRRIFLDVEEALSREVRRISYHDSRTIDKVVMRETYDPISGEVIVTTIEPEFYDSSADAGVVQYPHFFIRLMKTREDRFTGRVVPEYGKWLQEPVATSPKAYEIVLNGSATVLVIGNNITTSAFQIRKVQVGNLIRLLEGNNKGTYKVASITVGMGSSIITVSNILVNSLPSLNFDSTNRIVIFTTGVDLNTVKVGDNFIDSSSVSFSITAVNANNGKITIGGSGSPALTAGSNITRTGNVLQNTDLTSVRYIVMDSSKPIESATLDGIAPANSSSQGISPPIPIDAYYLIRIDSKTRENHIDILNRVWEEFNPPRTALPVISRSALSVDQIITVDVSTGGSNTIVVEDNSNYNIGDQVYIFDELNPTKLANGDGFERPFSTVIVGKSSTTNLVMQDVVPDTFKASNSPRVVSNAEFRLFMFNFVDHVTKDVEGSQYWVHEFTFWVQIWVDRLEEPKTSTVITDIAENIENIDTGDIYSEEF